LQSAVFVFDGSVEIHPAINLVGRPTRRIPRPDIDEARK
jgi:hypothetical protein